MTSSCNMGVLSSHPLSCDMILFIHNIEIFLRLCPQFRADISLKRRKELLVKRNNGGKFRNISCIFIKMCSYFRENLSCCCCAAQFVERSVHKNDFLWTKTASLKKC